MVWPASLGVPEGWHTDDFMSGEGIITLIKD
jgi:uncharacterized protein YbdZ (MbtH family)